MMVVKNYKPQVFAEMLGVTVKTLQRWDREGYLLANRTPTNRRYYTNEQYQTYQRLGAPTEGVVSFVLRISFDEGVSDVKQRLCALKQYFADNDMRVEFLSETTNN